MLINPGKKDLKEFSGCRRRTQEQSGLRQTILFIISHPRKKSDVYGERIFYLLFSGWLIERDCVEVRNELALGGGVVMTGCSRMGVDNLYFRLIVNMPTEVDGIEKEDIQQ